MNTAYLVIGAAFVAIGAAMIARGRKAGDQLKARNARLSGILMLLAGITFIATGAVAGS